MPVRSWYSSCAFCCASRGSCSACFSKAETSRDTSTPIAAAAGCHRCWCSFQAACHTARLRQLYQSFWACNAAWTSSSPQRARTPGSRPRTLGTLGGCSVTCGGRAGTRERLSSMPR